MADYIINRPMGDAEKERLAIQDKYARERMGMQAETQAQWAGIQEKHRLSIREDDRSRDKDISDKQRQELSKLDEQLMTLDSQRKALGRNILNNTYPPAADVGPDAVSNTHAFHERFAREAGLDNSWRTDKPAAQSVRGFDAWLQKQNFNQTDPGKISQARQQARQLYRQRMEGERSALTQREGHQMQLSRIVQRQNSVLGRQAALFQKLDYIDHQPLAQPTAAATPPQISGGGLQSIAHLVPSVLKHLHGGGEILGDDIHGNAQIERLVGPAPVLTESDEAGNPKPPVQYQSTAGATVGVPHSAFATSASDFHKGIGEYFGEDLEDTFGGTVGDFRDTFGRVDGFSDAGTVDNNKLHNHLTVIGRAKTALSHYMYTYENSPNEIGGAGDSLRTQARGSSFWRTDAGDREHGVELLDAKRMRYDEAMDKLSEREKRVNAQIDRNKQWHSEGNSQGVTLSAIDQVPDSMATEPGFEPTADPLGAATGAPPGPSPLQTTPDSSLPLTLGEVGLPAGAAPPPRQPRPPPAPGAEHNPLTGLGGFDSLPF